MRSCPTSPGWRLLGLTCGLALAACSERGAKTPENRQGMSRAECDIANDLLQREDRPREALDHALKATDLDAHNAEAAHLVALIYLRFCATESEDCRLDLAEKFARRAVEELEDFREAKNTLGVVLIHQRRYDEAIGILKPLSSDMLYTTPENAWGNLGWAYLEKGDTGRAIDALERSVAAQPHFCVGNYRLGLAYKRNRQLESAVEALTRALDTPGCESLQDGYAARAEVLLAAGRQGAAVADLQRCLELSQKTKTGKECSLRLRGLK